jgi:ubiquinone/menaquinone biosynthesis C-methylase UbiE
VTAPTIFTPEYYERMRALGRTGWWHHAMRDILARIVSQIALPSQGVLLDVGCGSGETLAWFASGRHEWRCIGIDLAWDGLRAVPPLPHGGAVRASALSLPLRSASVDLIVSQDVLQHLPLAGGDSQALIEMRRVLKPGGTLVLRTNAQTIPPTPDDHAFQFHRYATGELRRKLEAAGFTVDIAGRVNALLGLAEIPRERRAARATGRSYHGILARPPEQPSTVDALKRRWLLIEGRLVARGWSLPFGRTHLAVCRVPTRAGR